MRPEAETSGRGQPWPWSTRSWVCDVDTLTAFVDLPYASWCTVKQWKGHTCIHCAKWAWFCIAFYLVSCRFSDRWRGWFKQPSRGRPSRPAGLWRIVGGVWKSDPVLWVWRRLLSSQPASSRRRYQRGAGRVEEGALESRWREAAHRRAKRDGAEGEVRVWMEGYHLCQSPAIFVIRQIGVWPTRIVVIVRIDVLDIWRECHRVGPFVCRVLFPRGSSFCQDHIMYCMERNFRQRKISSTATVRAVRQDRNFIFVKRRSSLVALRLFGRRSVAYRLSSHS